MPLGGGEFKAYDKAPELGTWTIYKTIGLPVTPQTTGFTAGALSLDWAPDNEVFQIDEKDFRNKAEELTGHAYDDPENLLLREIFRHATTYVGYRLNSNGKKAKVAGVGEAKNSGKPGNNITVSVLKNINTENRYDVQTYFNGIMKDTQSVPEASRDEVALTKGEESKGEDVKPVFINNWGYVTSVDQLTSIPGLSSANLPQDKKNIFYFQFLETPKNGEQYSAIFDVDGTKYALPLWNLKDGNKNLYLWLSDEDMSGSFKLDGENWSANTESVDVTRKTVKVSLYNYGKKVTAAVLKGEPTETLLEDVEVSCSANVENGSIDAGTPATASFTFKDNTVTVQFSNVPEGYKPSVRVKGQVGILGFVPGRFEDQASSDGTKHVISYYPGAPINGTMTVEAVLTKDKITVLKSCTYTCALNEAVETGADATQLEDNDYVIFEKTGLIAENAGYTFSGGTTGTTITGKNHQDALTALEPYYYNDMFCNSTDDTVKALYVNNIDRLRRERGKYRRLWVYDYLKADNEAVSSVKNPVIGVGEEGDLVCWCAGYSSGIDMSIEMTNKPYDGELEIFTDYPEVQIPLLIEKGNFLFHNISLEEVRTYTDINTLQTYTEDHDDQLANNKVIRVLDYIHNQEQDIINRQDIGTLKNNPEGRTTLWNRCVDLLTDLWKAGVLRDFTSSDVEVLEVEDDKYAVIINQSIQIEGTVRRVYITTYVVE